MITLYNKTETAFTHNGLGVLDDYIISPVVTEELNGIFSLEFDYPIHATHGDELLPERIVRCPVHDMPDQLFRISERSDALGGLLHIVAHHVFYDLARNLIEDTNVVNKNGGQALAQMLGATQYSHPFTSSSNITATNTARMVRLNPAEAILDGGLDNGFRSRWSGEILRDNFHIAMNTVRGSNNGVQIRDKKNLTGYKADVDYSAVVTRIMPEGYNGLFLPEKYVDSPHIGDYIAPRIKVVKYDGVKIGEGEGELTEAQAFAALRALAAREFSANHVDLPHCSYDVEFAPLERTEEYKQFAALETVNLGDTVSVVHEEDGLSISARMISYKYDPLVKAYISVELGNAAPKFTNVVGEIKSVAVSAVQQAAENGTIVLPQSGDGGASNYYGSAEPAHPREGDLWFKENGDKLELWIYETREGVTQWWSLLSDLNMEEMKQELESAKLEVEQAKTAAEGAAQAGAAAQQAANQAQSEAQQATAKANQAFNDAALAVENAGNATQTAGAAFNKSVKSTAVSYAVSTSGTTAPTSGWQTAVPTVAAGQFLWTRTLITLQDNTTVTSYSVGKIGEQGAMGPAGATGAQGNPGATGAKGDKGDTGATGAKGDKGDKGDQGNPGAAGASGADAPTITAVREQFYLSTSQTAQSGGSWSDTVPVWSSGKSYWTRVVATYSNNSTTYSTPVLAVGLNNSLVTALEAKTSAEMLSTTVSQHATQISSIANNVTTLGNRVTEAETAIIQTADSFSLSLSKTNKAVNDLAGVSVLEAPWQQGTLSTSTGAESNSASYVRSGFFDVEAGKKYLLQTYEGTSAYSLYGTAYLFYFREDKSFLSYSTFSSSTTPFTALANARYLRVRFTTTITPASINCYLLQTETVGGYVNLSTMTSMVKLKATADTLMVTVSETAAVIGVPYKVQKWERGTINTLTGVESASSSYLRSVGYINVAPGEKFIAQMKDGTALTAYYYYYKPTTPYADFVPIATQYTAFFAAGTYDNSTIIGYLNGLDVPNMSITGTPTSNPYTSGGDYLAVYRLPLDGRRTPNAIRWQGCKDTSDNIVLLLVGSSWQQIGTVTATDSATMHEWTLTDAQRRTITGDNLHLAFYSIKNGSYAGIYNGSATPFTIALTSDVCFLSYSGTSGAVTIPANCTKMRVRVTSSVDPDIYQGNIYATTTRADYTKANTLYSALLMQKDLINLRVAKNDVVNQINISTEGILISGSKIRITGQTTIDNAVIGTAMIADAAITNAKIATLDAAKINTGTLSADRIAAGSITSAKLTVANGFITNAMIADATIQSAKIGAIDAAKITTGTLSAARIGANTITADKVSTNFLEALTGSSSIRITGYNISYYSGSSLTSQINSNGFELTRDSTKIGRIGTNNFASNSSWRGLVFDLEYAGNYMAWSWKESSSASVYTTKFTYYRSKLADGMEKGFHFDDVVFLKGGLAVASGGSVVTTQVHYWTLGSDNCYAQRTSNGKAGFAMGGNNLILGDDGQWVDFGVIREICKKLSGKTIAFPCAFDGSGQASSWYAPETFNSMTWWTT